MNEVFQHPIIPAKKQGELVLEMQGIVKSFPGVKALRGVDLRLHRGEVLAVLGENGAGKSTLMKVLGGAQQADDGALFVDGHKTLFTTPQASRDAGVAVIYQEFNLVPGLTAVENIFLGQEKVRNGFIDRVRERADAAGFFQKLGVEIDLDLPCGRLSTAQQQLVEIAKALAFNARILVLDEPTAALSPHEVGKLFDIIRQLKAGGMGIIYISHRLDEIFALCERVTFLRDGANVGERAIGDLTRGEMIALMVGRELNDEFPKRCSAPGEPCLEVRALRRGSAVRDVSLTVRKGEILALTGLVGSGRTETARLIFGADPAESGEIRVNGKLLSVKSPRDAIASGIGFLTEDRKSQGLVLNHSVLENFGLPNMEWLSRSGFVDLAMERAKFGGYVESLQIKIPYQEQLAKNLSGGNQQKVVLAKWLARDCEILIFDEPTRGIDVGAKFEIYLLMNKLVAEGKAIVMISSEMSEVLGMADRILVMHEGRVTGEIADARLATQEQIMQLAVA